MTWNIHGAVGSNPRFDLAKVVKLLTKWKPDITALQEVDSRHCCSGPDDPFAVLREALGTEGVSAKTITTADGDYGQMLISCCPMSGTEIHDISDPEREPRRAILTYVTTPQGTVRILATHLGLSIRERRLQSDKLLDIVGREAVTTLVLGDFNDWFWAGSVRSVLSRELPAYTRYRTFPSRFPMLRLDRVYCRPSAALVRSFVDTEARGISDHLPVIAEIRPL